jgi:capsular exopolysaccharide synthesis family protein
LEREYTGNLEIFKPEWPAMVQLKDRIERAQENVDSVARELVATQRQKAADEYQSALRREQNLLREINAIKDNMGIDSASVELTNLKVELNTRRQLLDDLIKRQSETEVAIRMQNTGESNVRIVDRALVPGAPYQPSLKGGVTGGGMAGLGVALLIIFLIEFMDRTIKSGEDAESRLSLPVLGVIPDMRMASARYGYYDSYGSGSKKRKKPVRKQVAGIQKRGGPATPSIEFIPLQQPRSAVSEAYRSLRTALLLSSAENLTTIAVSSAQPGEGKTSTAVNLAVVMEQLGKRVLLIDADLRKPRLHKIFKVPNRDGLVGCLARGVNPADAIQPTDLANLFVLSSGPVPPNPSELLASERMKTILRSAKDQFDLIIIDTPPILPVSDAVVVGAIIDGTVLCLQAGKVPRDEVVSARDRLQMGEVKILGVVLNFFKASGAGGRKRHYYYYQAYGESDSPDSNVPADSAA